MDLLIIVIVGFLVGLVARALMPGKGPKGLIVTTLLGIAGAWVGNWLFVEQLELANSIGFIGSVLGAMLLLFVHKLIFSRNKSRR